MADKLAVFECHNTACVIGSRKDPGRFTGGITAEQYALLTGEPLETLEEGKHFGIGVCPNCGEIGQPAVNEDGKTEMHESVVGDDPLQDLHNKLDVKLQAQEITSETAQAQLEKAAKANG